MFKYTNNGSCDGHDRKQDSRSLKRRASENHREKDGGRGNQSGRDSSADWCDQKQRECHYEQKGQYDAGLLGEGSGKRWPKCGFENKKIEALKEAFGGTNL